MVLVVIYSSGGPSAGGWVEKNPARTVRAERRALEASAAFFFICGDDCASGSFARRSDG